MKIYFFILVILLSAFSALAQPTGMTPLNPNDENEYVQDRIEILESDDFEDMGPETQRERPQSRSLYDQGPEEDYEDEDENW